METRKYTKPSGQVLDVNENAWEYVESLGWVCEPESSVTVDQVIAAIGRVDLDNPKNITKTGRIRKTAIEAVIGEKIDIELIDAALEAIEAMNGDSQ